LPTLSSQSRRPSPALADPGACWTGRWNKLSFQSYRRSKVSSQDGRRSKFPSQSDRRQRPPVLVAGDAKAFSRSPSKLAPGRRTRARSSLPCTPARRTTAPRYCRRPYTRILDEGRGRWSGAVCSHGYRQRLGQWRRRRSSADLVRWKPDEALGVLHLRLSSLRNLVEQIFGKIVDRFDERWSPMRCTLVNAVRIVLVRCKLHNFIFEERGRREDYLLRVARKVLVLMLEQRLVQGNPVLAPCLPSPLELSLQAGDDRVHALQGCGLGCDGPSLAATLTKTKRLRSRGKVPAHRTACSRRRVGHRRRAGCRRCSAGVRAVAARAAVRAVAAIYCPRFGRGRQSKEGINFNLTSVCLYLQMR
jgi:hypothetical protein